MKKYLLIAFLALSASCSFAQKKKMQPIDYNDKFAAITDSLYDMGVSWGNDFQRIAGSDKNYAQLASKRKAMSDFTARKIAEVQRETPVGKGGAELKAAMLTFLGYERDMINSAFVPLEKLTAGSSEGEVEAAINKLTSEAEKEGDYLKKVNEEQEKFASANGFTIEKQEAE